MESLELKKLIEKFGEQNPDMIAKVQIGEKPLEDLDKEMIDQFLKNEQQDSIAPVTTSQMVDELKRQATEAPAPR